MQAHRRLLVVDNRLRELSVVPRLRIELPFATRGIDRGDDAESIRQSRPRPPTPGAHRYRAPKSSKNSGTSHTAVRPRTAEDPMTPVTVPVIQTSSAHTVPLHSPDKSGQSPAQ